MAETRVGRALASPIGVLVTIPLLIVAVGVSILLVGRGATRTATADMARHQLATQAASIQGDIAFALDQADPMLVRIRVLADRAAPTDATLLHLAELALGRAGVAFVSISFPDGTFRGAYLDDAGALAAQESTIAPAGGHRDTFSYSAGALSPLTSEHADYDPRTRDFYKLAVAARKRVWTAPYPFFKTHQTGITCAEPVFDATGEVVAVLTVDFHVGALSSYVARPGLDDARSLVFSADGSVLVDPSTATMSVGDRVLHTTDLHDPAIDALYGSLTASGTRWQAEQAFVELSTDGGDYLASITAIGGKRAGVELPLDWYVGTIVPARTLLGPSAEVVRSSVLVSAGALAIAVGLAMVLAWNAVRMRRQVAGARAAVRDAEAKIQALGSYRLVAKLGAGGMGEVWKAEHTLLARRAAVKLIRPEALHDPAGAGEVRERFRREAQVLASMRSRHTIQLYDFGVTDDGVLYYVMELLDGLDLEALVVKHGPQPYARVIEILVGACGSLAEAHDAGLLHRDIKPPNLMLSRAADELDIVKLLDFGIALVDPPELAPEVVAAVEAIALPTSPLVDEMDSKLTRMGSLLGTPGFMAPEQIRQQPLDGRANLYALACVAWWLLTGKEVFSRRDGEAMLLDRHVLVEVPILHEAVRGYIPPDLEHVLERCLAKDPADRPRDARALAAELRAIPIPDDAAWTYARTLAWWDAYRPSAPAPALATAKVKVIVPRR